MLPQKHIINLCDSDDDSSIKVVDAARPPPPGLSDLSLAKDEGKLVACKTLLLNPRPAAGPPSVIHVLHNSDDDADDEMEVDEEASAHMVAKQPQFPSEAALSDLSSSKTTANDNSRYGMLQQGPKRFTEDDFSEDSSSDDSELDYGTQVKRRRDSGGSSSGHGASLPCQLRSPPANEPYVVRSAFSDGESDQSACSDNDVSGEEESDFTSGGEPELFDSSDDEVAPNIQKLLGCRKDPSSYRDKVTKLAHIVRAQRTSWLSITRTLERYVAKQSIDLDRAYLTEAQMMEATAFKPSTKRKRALRSKKATTKKKKPGQSSEAITAPWIEPYVEVAHLCSMEMDKETNLPVKQLTVHSHESDEILYDLKITVKKSSIPSGGNGVFLEYIGARRLTESSKRQGRNIMKNYKSLTDDITTKDLHAISPTGYGLTVKLTGTFRGDGGTKYAPKAGNIKPPKPLNNGIGLLGLHTEKDYEPLHDANFDTTCNCLYLGRYGPLLKSDRVFEEIYSLKDFVFSNGPAEYGFEVNEEIMPSGCAEINNRKGTHGRKQVVDITDEFGKPHQRARQCLPMYVNECSPAETYEERFHKKNVFIFGHYERAINFVVMLNTEMCAGEVKELFTEYGDGYMLMRDRRGYGSTFGVKPDTHLPSKLERDFADRWRVQDTVDATNTITELNDLIEWTLDKWRLLIAQNEPSNRLIVAMVKIQWLLGLFKTRMKVLENRGQAKMNPLEAYVAEYQRTAFLRGKKMLSEIRLQDFTVSQFLRHRVPQGDLTAAFDETQHQILFEISSKLDKPLEESVWCPLGATFLAWVSAAIAKFLLGDTNPYLLVAEIERIFGLALALLSRRDNLLFESGLRTRDWDESEVLDAVNRVQYVYKVKTGLKSRFLYNCTTPKSVAAKAFSNLESFQRLDVAALRDSKFLMTATTIHHSGSSDIDCLASLPLICTMPVEPNITWYKIWQLGYPALVILTKYLKSESTTNHLKFIAKQLDLEEHLLRFAFTKGFPESALTVNADSNDMVKVEMPPKEAKQARTVKMSPKKKKKAPVKHILNNSCKDFEYRGPPRRELSRPWPRGWLEVALKRQSGASKGHVDCYWYSPLQRHRLRSLKHVEEYLAALDKTNGDEIIAWDMCGHAR